MKNMLVCLWPMLYADRPGHQQVKIFKYVIAGCLAGVASSSFACTILEFGAENLLNPGQNTPQITFQEIEAFAAGLFPTRPIFTGTEPLVETGLNTPIDLTGFGYAGVHYAQGTSGNPTFNRGGSLVFYYIGPDARSFIFPQVGPGNTFSNGPITSVTLFAYLSIPDAGASVVLFAIALGGVLLMIIYGALGRRASG